MAQGTATDSSILLLSTPSFSATVGWKIRLAYLAMPPRLAWPKRINNLEGEILAADHGKSFNARPRRRRRKNIETGRSRFKHRRTAIRIGRKASLLWRDKGDYRRLGGRGSAYRFTHPESGLAEDPVPYQQVNKMSTKPAI